MKRLSYVFLVILFCSVIHAQDTIQGMYSYTYGDSESLVEARQTCKDLALRDAIESYYLFVESTSTVENYQMKEDLVQSIAAGNLTDVQIIEQTEEGRTITMTVSAVVNPNEVQSLVAARAEKQESSGIEPSISDNQNDTSFFTEMDQLENQALASYAVTDQNDIQGALNAYHELMHELNRHQPSSANPFQFVSYQCIRQRLQVQSAMAKLRYYRSKKKLVQARNQKKTLEDLSQVLQKKTKALQSFENLSDTDKKSQIIWVKRCNETLAQSKKMVIPFRRR